MFPIPPPALLRPSPREKILVFRVLPVKQDGHSHGLREYALIFIFFFTLKNLRHALDHKSDLRQYTRFDRCFHKLLWWLVGFFIA